MTTAEMTETEKYLHSDLVTERAESLQTEAEENNEGGGVFILYKINIEFIEKLDYKTKTELWTDKEKADIRALTQPMHERVREFCYKELQQNDKLGLLQLQSGTSDFKTMTLSPAKMLKTLLEMTK